ncbi:hypothetical protein GDO86_005767 [Hymenochirus boettgeri]|nr:hypothetical protein GDO86_005767 [Hymenochirus boettgeri]
MEVTSCLSLKDLIGAKKSKCDPVPDGRSSYKENMFERFKVSPKLALRCEPIDLSKQKSFTPERVPVTPVKVTEKPQTDPWTPTANLKMLISAASPEIRDREKKKELFRPIENNGIDDTDSDLLQVDTVDDIDDLEKRPSRKQKSLGLLCQKFLARYPSYPISSEKLTISLDEAACSLGVERRRIYDIVNVLESLQLVSRVAKNQYCWHGQHNLNETLRNLQRLGEKQNYRAQIACFYHREMGIEYKWDEQKKSGYTDHQNIRMVELSEADCPSASSSSRKDKSLRIMSQKFVMLFLVSATKMITLEIAAKILIEESQDSADHSKFKTKVRRLYDIANVLTSLRLIKKVHVTDERGRKPAFKWIGPADFLIDSEDQKMEVTTTTPSPDSKKESGIVSPASDHVKQRLFRHSSFSIVQSPTTAKKVCAQPCSPHRYEIGSEIFDNSKMPILDMCGKKSEKESKQKNSACRTGNTEPLPFSVVVPVSLDSDYSVTPVSDRNLVTPKSALTRKINFLSTYNSHDVCTNQGLIPNQPYMYVPSNSVLMLCENLPEGRAYEQIDMHACQSSDSDSQSDENGLCEDKRSTKRQRIGSNDAPLSLVLPKKAPKKDDHQSGWKTVCKTTTLDQLQNTCVGQEGKIGAIAKLSDAETTTELVDNKQVFQEHMQPHLPSQFLYVPSTPGLNGFNFLLPANHSMGLSPSSLASLNVPCVMVPSSSLTAFPFICSQAMPSRSSALNAACVNFNQTGATSPISPVVGCSSVVTQLCETPLDQTTSTSMPVSPVSGKCSNSVKARSPVCVNRSVTTAKSQKLPKPSTPKSIRPLHKDTFFKTPGSLESSASRKGEGPFKKGNLRSSSSAQRRLEIGNSSGN